jgi:hypothetical protein
VNPKVLRFILNLTLLEIGDRWDEKAAEQIPEYLIPST